MLRQEIDRFNQLLHVVHSTLASLTLAIKGEIIMSEALEDAYKALFKQGIPAQWKVSPSTALMLRARLKGPNLLSQTLGQESVTWQV